jgi:hypothetical protein
MSILAKTGQDGAFGGIEQGIEPSENDLLAGWEIHNGMLLDFEVTGNIWERNKIG